MLELKKHRITKELTQQEVADKVNISRVAYTNIENGVRRPSPEVAMRIAEALGFDWTRFYTEEMKPEERAVEPEAR
jgi:putative transcriptional regulator